jgi:cob(I)alamin adenosyltransferase
MALYTGQGDSGTTKVLNSKTRFSKASERAEALGSLDEINSFLGLCKVRARAAALGAVADQRGSHELAAILHEVQENLFIVQAEMAGADMQLTKEKLNTIEDLIAAVSEEVEPITEFSIPGSGELSAMLDVGRTQARRMERHVVAVHDSGEHVLGEHTIAYCNRLSSLLFGLARLVEARGNLEADHPSYQ